MTRDAPKINFYDIQLMVAVGKISMTDIPNLPRMPVMYALVLQAMVLTHTGT
jgi:hypothetical protein